MGIQGLMSFVGLNTHFFHELQMKNTKLIIDGNNLYHKLYFDSGLDLAHGGDYDLFTDVLCKFFESLTLCDIQAYVVFDGGCDISDKKLETQKQRIRDKIKMVESLSCGRGGSVLPLLVRDVCIQVLRKLQVPFVQCFSEADREIVALANLWNCPVLTFDSDFCIFDVKAGYCPQNSFQWKNVVAKSENQDCYISAQCFSVQRFCKYFNNLKKSLLPLFAVLTGNDYLSLPAMDIFFSKVHLPIGNSSHGGRKHARIRGLLHWLSGFENVEEAMDNVLKYFQLKDRNSIRQLLYSAMEEYSLYDTVNLEPYFQSGLYVSPTAIKLNLPDWVQQSLARGELSPILSDALVLRRVFLHVQVEDLKRPSAHLITQPIRKVIYSILFNINQNSQYGPQGSKHPNQPFVVEFDRLGTTLRRSIIEINFANEEFSDLSFKNLPELPTATRLCMLLRALDLRKDDQEFLPSAYQLIVAILCYWIRYSDPKVKQHHFKGLLMGIVYGETYNILNKPELQGDGIKLVCEQINRIKMDGAQQRRLNWEDLHILCQWQCCLQMVMHFNQLLSTPLPEPDITRLYNGSLVYHLSQKIKSSPTIDDLFKPCPQLEKLYHDCIHAVMSIIPQDCFNSNTKSASSKSKKKSKKGKKVASTKVCKTVEKTQNCQLSNRFSGLLLED